MKNTLIINLNSGYDLEHISNVNDGTDRLVLQLKCDASAGVRVSNSLGSLNVTADKDNFVLEIPKPLWIGLGTETITITVGEGGEAVSYALTINKTPACGGNYQAGRLGDDYTFWFLKVKEVSENVYDANRETIVGTWIDGRPIYRKFIAVDMSIGAGSTIYVEAKDMFFDKLVNFGGFIINSSNKNTYPLPIYMSSSYYAYVQTGNMNTANPRFNIYSSVAGTITAYVEYTKLTDPIGAMDMPAVASGPLMDEWTLAWEGDLAADSRIDLPESMMMHKQLAFEIRNAAVGSAASCHIYRVPVEQFKMICDYALTVNAPYMLSDYDNRYSRMFYVNDLQLYYDFTTTDRIRRVWFID